MLVFGLILSLFGALNLPNECICFKVSFSTTDELLKTGEMFLDEVKKQTDNERVENEADDKLDSPKANGKALEVKSDIFLKAVENLCNSEIEVGKPVIEKVKANEYGNLLAVENFCQNWKNRKSIRKEQKEAENGSVASEMGNLKMNPKIHESFLRTLAEMKILNPENEKEFGKLAKFGIDLRPKITKILEELKTIADAPSDQTSAPYADQPKDISKRRVKKHNNRWDLFKKNYHDRERCSQYVLLALTSSILFTDMTVRLSQEHTFSIGNSSRTDEHRSRVETFLQVLELFVWIFSLLIFLGSFIMAIFACRCKVSACLPH
ncbi:hypothetical protein niasHT_003684 [Heterodera trifolii]|uniref:Uncharacterized protein n=1 Tax=Heterodera trifolii TaxID=157864 RepID=A0ABD2M8Y8_9BILA